MRQLLTVLGAAIGASAIAAVTTLSGRAATPPPHAKRATHLMAAHASTATLPAAEAKGVINNYCLECHDKDHEKGGLELEDFDPGHPELRAETAEKMIKKLRAGMMPPAGHDRPAPAVVDAFASTLETRLDVLADLHPNPGHRTFQRLNRSEYAKSINELLGFDVDVNAFLPPDTVSHNFDDIADVESLSPTLLEGYLRAAAEVSREAVGDPDAAPSSTIYKVPRLENQLRHVDGAPFGTRGGISIVHVFPADGQYSFRAMLHSIPTGQLYGSDVRGQQIEVSINGERVALLDINPRMSESDPNGMNLETPPIAVKAGPQRVSAAFIERSEAPFDDVIAPIEQTLADTQIGSGVGVTTLPHLREFAILGPQHVTGVSDTPIRRRIFTCRPLTAAEETPCATKILDRLATVAYRRPVNDNDIDGLMKFFTEGRKKDGFEGGIRTAIQAMLASPDFIFRLEQEPASVHPGQTYRLNDLDLASRLSFFLWGEGPDKPLITAATHGELGTIAGLEQQTRRMLKDPRAFALSTRFASQWLHLQDLDKIHPDARLYPEYDETLADAMRQETELFFNSIVREDRDVLDLLTANYTFVNERLARHYGIPNVSGPAFRRVTLTDPNRRGILGEGSILTMTSVADRTSPVLRGKWVLQVLLGFDPPPPPPGVPPFDDSHASAGGHLLSVRARMEEHRKNPACQSCHRIIDPIGLALENFDVTGAWRIHDNGAPIDPTGTLYDGTALGGPAGLRAALLNRKDTVLRVFTENLMAYALGRRIDYYDEPTVRKIVREAEANQDRFSSYVLGVVKSPAFRMSVAEPLDH